MERLERAIIELKPWDDALVHVSLINQCGSLNALFLGELLHSRLRRSGSDRETFVGNHLIQMYGKCGSLDRAFQVFTSLHSRNLYSWNILISAYAQNGDLVRARIFFDKMVERDCYSWTTMIAAYADQGESLSAEILFIEMPERDVPSWNALLSGCSQSSRATEMLSAMEMEGLTPNKMTFMSMFSSLATSEDLQLGHNLHTRMLGENPPVQVDIAVENSLIAMYGRCGSLERAEETFGAMKLRNVVSWTSLISLYAGNDLGDKALRAFKLMDLDGVHPNFVTFTSTIEACIHSKALAEGRILHQCSTETGDDRNVVLATALLNMYAKCGSLASAREVFDKMSDKNIQSWSSMIAAYAQSGRSELALETFAEMGVEGQVPNGVTFVVVLMACVHAGKLEDGWSYFASIVQDYGITLVPDHYNCMVDLLARTGRLDEAQELIRSMPFEPQFSTLVAYLGSCKTHQDTRKGEFVAEKLGDLGSQNASPYMLLSNIVAFE